MSKFVPRLAFILAAAALTAFLAGGAVAFESKCAQDSDTQLEFCSGSTAVSYTVREGDTLYEIAQEHRVSLRELMQVNNLTESLIRPGDVLELPEPVEVEIALSRGKVSREELMLLARIIHAEARGESFEGKVAVGAVVLNRIRSPHFPKPFRMSYSRKTTGSTNFRRWVTVPLIWSRMKHPWKQPCRPFPVKIPLEELCFFTTRSSVQTGGFERCR